MKPLFIALIILLSGCAAFPSNKVKPVEKMPDVSAYSVKPSVYFDVKFYSGSPDSPKAVQNFPATKQLKTIVEKVAKEGQLFSAYTMDADQAEKQTYEITLKMYNDDNSPLAMASGFVSGFTFGVIPGAGTDNYTLKATVTGNDTTSEYRNDDKVTLWVGLWFIPFMSSSPGKVVPAVIENQIRDALKQFIDTKQIKYAKPHAMPISSWDTISLSKNALQFEYGA